MSSKTQYPPELQRQIDSLVEQYGIQDEPVPPEVDESPRFVFSRSTPFREVGMLVKIRNGLDEEMRGGTILGRIGRAYRVQCDDTTLVVHEPDDSWS